jgi:hypothetical protein
MKNRMKIAAPVCLLSAFLLFGCPAGSDSPGGETPVPPPQRPQSAAPTAAITTVNKTSSPQGTIVFALTSTHTGIWKVYYAAAGGSPRTDVSAAFTAPALSLTASSGNIAATTYYVSVTEDGKTESARLALIVGPYTTGVPETVIGGAALDLSGLVTQPVAGYAPNTAPVDTAWYTGTVNWIQDDETPAPALFAAGTAYTAVLHLTAKSGWTFAGIAANVFSCANATSCTNSAGSGEVRITFPAAARDIVNLAIVRYEVNAAGSAFTATPKTGAPWNATLHNVNFKTVNGLQVIEMGLDEQLRNGGWVDLGAQLGAIIKPLPNFTIETYVCIPQDSNLMGSGHFIWTLAAQDPSVSAPTATSGKYLYLQASAQRFAISKQGWNNEQKTADLGSIAKGYWKHIVLTRQGNTAKLYIDGILKDTKTLTVAMSDMGDLNYNYLAKAGFSGDHYLRSAQYYRLNVYDEAFTADEIANHLGAQAILAAFPLPPRIEPKPNTTPMLHVGGLHTAEDFTRIKSKLNLSNNSLSIEPWKSGYQKLLDNEWASNMTSINNLGPSAWIVRGGSVTNDAGETVNENYISAARNAVAAYQLALRWKISGDASFAAKAVSKLNAWPDVCTTIAGTSDACLAAGLYGFEFAVAAELLRDYSGWAPADFAKFQNWMLTLFYPKNLDFLERHNDCYDDHYWANWDLCNLASMMAIAILCDQRDIYNYVVEYLQTGRGNGNWYKAINYIHNANGETLGQNQESGRDQGHGTLNISLMGAICQLAWNQGDDFFGLDDNRFLKCCEYVAKYNMTSAAITDIPFAEYTRWWGNKSAAMKKTADGSIPNPMLAVLGDKNTGRPIWSLPYYHYAIIKGLPAAKVQYTKMGMDLVGAESGPMGSTSGGYDQLGLGTLMYSR